MQSILLNAGQLIVVALAVGLVLLLEKRVKARAFWPVVALLAAVLGFAGFRLSDKSGQFEDFRLAYWEAGAAIWKGPASFGEVYARGTDGFVNLPVVGFLFAPFGLLDQHTAAIVFTLLGIVAAVMAWRLLCVHLALPRREAAVLAIAFASFGPLLYSLSEGNLSHFLLLGLSGALLCFASGRHFAAGAIFGLIAVLKPSLGLIGIYFLCRGQWRVVAGGAAVCAGAALSSLALFGWSLNLLWYEQAVAPFAAGPVPGFNAQSIPAFVARFETGIAGLTNWGPHVLSAAGRVWAIVLCGLVGAAFLATCFRRPSGLTESKSIELETLMVVTLSCVVSSLSWSHYYLWLLPAFAWAWQFGTGRERTAVLVAFILCAPLEFIGWPMLAGYYSLATNFLASHLLAGGLLLFGVMLRQRWRA
jgi:alpha-1,2-mannosyltransferase